MAMTVTCAGCGETFRVGGFPRNAKCDPEFDRMKVGERLVQLATHAIEPAHCSKCLVGSTLV